VLSESVETIEVPSHRNREGLNYGYEERTLRRFEFEVEEGFLGVGPGRVAIYTGRGGGDCGYHFQVGQGYVVYASRMRGSDHLSTGICSRTAPLEEAEDDLTYGRLRARGAVPTMLYGQVRRSVAVPGEPGTEEPGRMTSEHLSGATVTALGKNELQVSATSDDRGRFMIEVPEAGEYRVSALWRGAPVIEGSVSVQVGKGGCEGVSVEASNYGEVKGRVMDDEGGVPSRLDLSLLLKAVLAEGSGEAEGEEEEGRSGDFLTGIEEDGSFRFRRVKPGQYRLFAVESFESGRLPKTYYPGVLEQDAAEIITVEAGPPSKLEVFLLPALAPRIFVQGRVEWPDGEAGAGLWVELETVGDEGKNAYVETDRFGRFAFEAFEGFHYSIAVRTVPGGPPATEPLSFIGQEVQEQIVLTLPSGD